MSGQDGGKGRERSHVCRTPGHDLSKFRRKVVVGKNDLEEAEPFWEEETEVAAAMTQPPGSLGSQEVLMREQFSPGPMLRSLLLGVDLCPPKSEHGHIQAGRL